MMVSMRTPFGILILVVKQCSILKQVNCNLQITFLTYSNFLKSCCNWVGSAIWTFLSKDCLRSKLSIDSASLVLSLEINLIEFLFYNLMTFLMSIHIESIIVNFDNLIILKNQYHWQPLLSCWEINPFWALVFYSSLFSFSWGLIVR